MEHNTFMDQQADGTVVIAPESGEREELDLLYQGAWQRDHFFCRHFLDAVDLDRLMVWDFKPGRRQFNGRAGNRVFQVNLGMIINSEISPKDNSASSGAVMGEEPLNTVLNFGVWGPKLNSFQWRGNSFETELGYEIDDGLCVERRFDALGQLIFERTISRTELAAGQPPISGELIVQDGYPIKLLIPPRQIECAFEYIDGRYLGNGIPNKISVTGADGQIDHRYEILRISIQNEELPANHFGPERFFDPRFIAQARVAADGHYVFDDPAVGRAYFEAHRKYFESQLRKNPPPDPPQH